MSVSVVEDRSESAPPGAAGSRAHLPFLDGIRGVAIAAILIHHFGILCNTSAPMGQLWRRSTDSMWIGVDLFFVLSGFLITRILLAAKGRSRYFINFYGRRTVRIFPLYYGILALFFVVMPLLHFRHPAAPLRSEQIWFWTYLSNFRVAWTGQMFPSDVIWVDHFWSLALEEQFYLVWPALVFLLSRRGLKTACVIAVALALVARLLAIFAFHLPWATVYVFPLFRIDTLCCGALLAILDEREIAGAIKWARWVLAAGAMLLVGTWISRRGLYMSDRYAAAIVLTLTGPFFAVFILTIGALPTSAISRRLLESGFLRALGKYSYGLYVFHYPLVPFYVHLFNKLKAQPEQGYGIGSTLLFTVMCSICSVAIAFVSFHVFEAQFLKLKRFFADVPVRTEAAAFNAVS